MYQCPSHVREEAVGETPELEADGGDADGAVHLQPWGARMCPIGSTSL